MTTQAQERRTIPEGSGKVVVEDHRIVGYRDEDLGESPFAALATLKTQLPVASVEVAPVAEAEAPASPEVVESERTPVENAALAAELITLGVANVGDNTDPPESAASTAQKPKLHGERKQPHGKGPRTPQYGGIRKIELVQVQEVAPAPPPSGSIRLGAFLRFANVAQLTYAASEVAEKGATPDVVVWAKTKSGFDHIRIRVALKDAKEHVRDGKSWAHLEISEATGKFENLAQYIGQEIRYGEVMGAKESIPPSRASRTAALNAVLVEADQHLREAEARRRASTQGNKGNRK